MRGVGGTVSHLLTLGERLPKLGHEVVVYSPDLVPFADFASGRGLDVGGDLAALPRECDVVLSSRRAAAFPLRRALPPLAGSRRAAR